MKILQCVMNKRIQRSKVTPLPDMGKIPLSTVIILKQQQQNPIRLVLGKVMKCHVSLGVTEYCTASIYFSLIAGCPADQDFHIQFISLNCKRAEIVSRGSAEIINKGELRIILTLFHIFGDCFPASIRQNGVLKKSTPGFQCTPCAIDNGFNLNSCFTTSLQIYPRNPNVNRQMHDSYNFTWKKPAGGLKNEAPGFRGFRDVRN